jgi:hypothetical protein
MPPALSQPPARRAERPALERRGHARFYYRQPLKVRCRQASRWGYQSGWAILRDLSRGGVGLILGLAPKPGTFLLLKLPGTPGRQTRLAQVVHVQARRDGNFLAGCQLVPPLSEEDLSALQADLGVSVRTPPPA